MGVKGLRETKEILHEVFRFLSATENKRHQTTCDVDDVFVDVFYVALTSTLLQDSTNLNPCHERYPWNP